MPTDIPDLKLPADLQSIVVDYNNQTAGTQFGH